MDFTGERMIPEYNREGNIYLEHITRYYFSAQFVKDKTVLDIACGSGYGSDLLLKLGAKKVFGVDVSEETVEYCKKEYRDPNLDFQVGSCQKIPLEDHSVDVVISFETIEHIDGSSQDEFLAEVKRVLKPDGMFIVSTPSTNTYPKGNPFHIKELSPEEFFSLLRKNFSCTLDYYQNDVEASYLFSKETLVGLKRENITNVIDFIPPERNLYLVGVCSNKSINVGNIQEQSVLSKIITWEMVQNYDREAEMLRKIIKQKDQEITKKDQEIIQKDQQVALMRSSKFWKLRRIYIDIKDKLKIR